MVKLFTHRIFLNMEDDFLVMYTKDWEQIRELIPEKIACIYVIEKYLKIAYEQNLPIYKYRVTDNPDYDTSRTFPEGDVIFSNIKAII